MALGVLEKSGRKDILEEIDPFRDQFLKNVPEEDLEKLSEEIGCLYFAFGRLGLYYLDDWTLDVSRALERIHEEFRMYQVSKEDFRKAMHKYIHFIHEHRPFKNGLPI